MNLVLDFGNTLIKRAIFKNAELIDYSTSESIAIDHFPTIVPQKIDAAILSSVINYPDFIHEQLKQIPHFIVLDKTTPIPIKNKYKTPATLGNDRLACAVGANNAFPDQNVLIVDAGTCIKYDFVTANNEYWGGGISPGILMRFKALHHFTDKLPLVTWQTYDELIGTSTEASILSGVLNGALAEVNGIIARYKSHYNQLNVVVTGGDHSFFEKVLKNSIFADPFLSLKGLNIILEYNVKK
jgi:type III pantothenate kinase